MKKIVIVIFLSFLFNAFLFGQEKSSFSQLKWISEIQTDAEKFYENGTRICYLNIYGEIPETYVQSIANHVLANSGVLRFHLYYGKEYSRCMCETKDDFTNEQLAVILDEIIDKYYESGAYLLDKEKLEQEQKMAEMKLSASSKTNIGADNCEDALAICADGGSTGVNFSVTENNPEIPAPAGQCGYLKNATWWYFQIESLGYIEMEIASCGDVDFACYGPFDNLTCDPADLVGSGTYTWYDNGNSGSTTTNSNACPVDNLAVPSGNLADAAYSIDATEILNITPVNVGDYYILIIANYNNCTGTVSVTQTNIGNPGAGSVNCDIVSDCNISSISATTACTGATFSVSGEIFFTDPPNDGTLTICEGSVCQTFYPPFTSPTPYTLTNLSADGLQHQLTATFASTTTNCDKLSFYNAPICATTAACPDYANTVSSAAEHCAGQTYYLEVQNTDCNGDIYFDVVGNYGSSWANEITWEIVSSLTSNVVASGGPGVNGANIFSVVGPIDAGIEGNVFYLYVYDAYGDGFNGTGGYITIEQSGTAICSSISGNFGAQAHVMFMPSIVISPAIITVTTPSGNVTQTAVNCNDFHVPMIINSLYFCTTTTVNLPWEIRCQYDNSLLSSGTHSLTIYPNTPDDISDIVDISFDEANC